ncbi:MAG: hypothetical protein ACR2K5_11115 [Pseudolabrys sp.]
MIHAVLSPLVTLGEKMKPTVKRGKKKRLKSLKEVKRDIAKADYPIAETLHWVADGEELLRKWGALKSPAAKRIAKTFSTLIGMLETINELRKM